MPALRLLEVATIQELSICTHAGGSATNFMAVASSDAAVGMCGLSFAVGVCHSAHVTMKPIAKAVTSGWSPGIACDACCLSRLGFTIPSGGGISANAH